MYAKNCLRHAQSELLGLFTHVTKSCSEGWRARECTMYEVEASPVSERVFLKKARNCRRHFDVEDLSDLKGHMLIYRGHLFYSSSKSMSCGCRADSLNRGQCKAHPEATARLNLIKLQSMQAFPDSEADKHQNQINMMYSIGFCDNLVKSIAYHHSFWLKLEEKRGSASEDSNPEPLRVLDWIRDPASAHRLSESGDSASAYRENAEDAEATALREGAVLNLAVLNDKADVELRPEQREILASLQAPVEFIQGPPGTGKSTLMRSVLRNRIPNLHGQDELGDVTLFLAVQNKAIDVLVRMFEPYVDSSSVSSSRMLVVGSASNASMGDTAARFTLQSRLESHPVYARALKEYEECSLSKKRLKKQEHKLNALKKAKEEATLEIFSGVRIMFSTFTELHKIVENPDEESHSQPLSDHFSSRVRSVIIDEGGTVPEYEVAVISGLPRAQRILCIGDTKQLPPFSNIRKKPPLGFMERAQENLRREEGDEARLRMRMLTRQFRMSRNICKLVSNTFYDGRLIMDATESKARSPEYFPDSFWLGTGIFWIDYKRGGEGPTHHIIDLTRQSGEVVRVAERLPNARHSTGTFFEEKLGFKIANATEVGCILEGIRVFARQGFFAKGQGAKVVAVICFYREQVEVLIATMQQDPDPKFTALLQSEFLRIQTVDSSQGSEADIVVLSGVRSNADKDVGFLERAEGKKRMCVALSRAKETLIIVGDRATLCCKGLAFERLWKETEEGGEEKEDEVRPEYNLAVKGSFAEMVGGGGGGQGVDEALYLFGGGGGGAKGEGEGEGEGDSGEFLF